MPKEIKKIAKDYMKNPVELSLIDNKRSPSKLKHQFYYSKSPKQKHEDLLALLKKLDPTQTLIFAGSRIEVESLTRFLKGHLPHVDFLHGGLEQSIRTIITQKFAKGRIKTLVLQMLLPEG